MKFENTEVWGFQHAMRGMRNPMNSWDKSDSDFGIIDTSKKAYLNTGNNVSTPITDLSNWKDGIIGTYDGIACYIVEQPKSIIGKNDLKLAQSLIKSGSEHRKFMRQIFVSVDITAPLYWWKEFDTYKVGTVANSTSTMHKLATTPITIGCFETDDCNWGVAPTETNILIEALEQLRQDYSETKDKRYWKELIRWLPESWLQTRTVTMSYENIFSIVHQRKNHKLNEWSGIDNPDKPNFIAWARTLPYAKELIFLDEEV